MSSRHTRIPGRLLSTAGLTVALGILVWAVVAFAAATVQTYSDGTYTTVKTKFGRGVDDVYSRMVGGFNSLTYYAEYWGPSTDGGTDLVYKSRGGSLTASGTGVCDTSLVTAAGDNSGMWQTRFHHNPQYTLPAKVVIDSPAAGQVVEAGVAIPNSMMFHLEDRDGNIITADMMSSIRVLFKDGGSTEWRDNRAITAVSQNKAGWQLSSGYYKLVSSNKDGNLPYTPLTNGDMLQFTVRYVGGTEPGDTYGMGDVRCTSYTKVGNPPASDTYPYWLVPADSMNPMFVGNPSGTTYNYTYYFDLKDYSNTDITTGAFTWTRTATEAMDYDADTLQTTVTGTVPVYDGTAGHWKTSFTLPAPGKYLIHVVGSMVNAPEACGVVNFGATKQWEMAGDVLPPAEASFTNWTGTDNVIDMGWDNPADSDLKGVLILRNTASISDAPSQEVRYSVDGAGGVPNTINTSRVVYCAYTSVPSGSESHSDGDPCIPSKRRVNGTMYYFKAFTYDADYNYSSGAQISETPVDNAVPAIVTGQGFTEGDKENTILWTNPSDCDFSGVTIRYRTDGTFPSKRDGTDGSVLAGNKNGGTPGAADSFLHTSLTNGTPYYYTIWAKDDDGNWNADPGVNMNGIGNGYAVPHDVTAPAAISDLAIKAGSVSAFDVILEWTATGDDGTTGQATKYDIRFYDQPITEGNFDEAWHAVGENPPQPVPYGGVQEYMVAGLSPLTQYYFSIRAADEVPNWSAASNSPTATTTCNEELTACNQCHLMPPDDDLPGAHPRGSGNIGSHDLPIHASADAAQCNVCHADGDVFDEVSGIMRYGFNHQNFFIEMNGPGKIGNLAERESSTGGTFMPQTTIVYKYKNYSSGVGYKQLTGYCDDTYCHGAGLSSPRWGLEKIVCGEYCHETPPATGRHVKHYHPGQHYINFAPAGTAVSGYEDDDGSTGWSPAAAAVNRGSGAGGSADARYATFIQSAGTQEEFILPDGTWYITVCVGDPSGALANQKVEISGDSPDFVSGNWDPIIDNFDTTAEKLFKKIVDHEFIVSGGNNLKIKIGNGSDLTKLNFMIVNATPEAPKSNVTLLQNTPSEYGFACGKCHTMDIAQARHTEHVASPFQEGIRDAEVYFDGNSFPKNPFGLYTVVGFANISSKQDGQGFDYTTGRSCVNTYCHGSTLGAGGTNTDPQWRDGYIDVLGADLCGACHDSGYADTSPTTNINTGSHDKHVGQDYAYRVDCAKCHYHTVAFKDESGVINISDKTHHVNGDVDAVFDPNDNTMKFGRYSTSIMTCYDVYCHSNGLLTPSGEPASYTRYADPVWASGSKTCNYCHGTDTADGMPNYFNSLTTPNSHVAHVLDNNQGCSVCHNDTTRDNGLTIYTTVQPTLHVNGQGEVDFDWLNPSGTYNNGNLQCSNTYCHGLTAPPTWGGVATCGSCHGDGVDNPNPGIGQHAVHNDGNHGNISTIDANKSTQTNHDFDCRFCHFTRTHGGGPYEPGVQAAEANFSDIDVANGYNNAGADYVQGGSTYLDVNNWEYTDGSCRNVKCHSDGRGGLGNNTTFKWTDGVGSIGCYGCHGGGAASPAGKRIDTFAHGEHVWSSVYRKLCQDCHEPTATGSNTITDRSKHVNGQPDVGISTVWGGTYTPGDNTCDNNDCHSNADPSAWGGAVYYALVNWTTSEHIHCTTCHSDSYHEGGDAEGRTAAQTLSLPHGRHLSNGYSGRFSCSVCHATTVPYGSTTSIRATVPTKHNNQQKDVVYNTDSFFNMTGPNCETALGGYWGTWNNPVPGNCTVICHTYVDINTGDTNNPVWFPNWSSVNYGCRGCHPDRFSGLTSGSHMTHVNPAGNNFNCGACHSRTAEDYGNFTGSTQKISLSGYTSMHLNFTYETVLSSNVGGSWDGGARTCATTAGKCHTTGSPVWGTVATCTDCHMDAGAVGSETDDYVYGNSTIATINQTEYDSVGHGLASASTYTYSGNSGAQLDCLTNCHDSAIPHGQGTNPFRLQNADTNALCASCHAAAQSDHHNQTNTGGDGDWNFTPKCVDCHDPHGDYSDATGRVNRLMIQGYVNYTTASSTYGVPTFTKSVGFPDNGGGAEPGSLGRESYVQSDYSGLCQICHTAGGNPANFSRDQYVTSHSGTSACSACHTHPTGFKGAGDCNTCHSSQGAGVGGTAYTGKHQAHTDSTKYVLACELCHATLNGGSNTSHKTGHVTDDQSAEVVYSMDAATWTTIQYEGGGTTFNYIQMDAAYGLSGITPAYTHWTTATDLTDPINTAHEWTQGRCGDIWCHSNANPMGGSMTYQQFANWSTAETATCSTCHGGPGTYAAVSLSNAHKKHIGTDRYSITCSRCHKATVATGDSPVTDYSRHVDGAKDISFNTAGSWASPNCSNLYCHGDGNGAHGGAAWNGSATTCVSCHDGLKADDPNHMATGKHAEHINNSDANLASFTCDDCHSDTTTTGNTITGYTFHVNSSVEVTMPAGSFNGSNCLSTACHNTGQATPTYLSPSWTTGTLGCNGCHGTDNFYTDINGMPDYENVSTATRNTFNGHQVTAHVSAATDCIDCHNSTVDASGAIKAGSAHLDGSREVAFAAGGSYANKRCSGTDAACHGAVTPRWGGALDCYDCHVDTGSIGTELDNYTYGSGGKATINELEWLNAGHGKTSGSYPYTGNTAANLGCLSCHSSGVAHNTGTNPFRLTNANTNTLCGGCHNTSVANHHTFAVVDPVHVGGSDATWTFTPKCVDCHDPHGDNGGLTTNQYNAAMIHSAVNSSGSDTYGVPAGTTNVDFPTGFPGGSFVWGSFVDSSNPYNGLCQVCHIGPSTAGYFNSALYTAGHNSGVVCDSCHTHPDGFAGAGGSCTGCHGTGGSGVGGAKNRRNIETDFGMNSHHINATSGLWANVDTTSCAACHPEGNYFDGGVNATYHNDGVVHLKQWTGSFPAPGNNGTFTVATFANGTTTKATTHCLGCHNATNASATPFSASGDSGTPSTYDVASGGTNAGSISVRYSATNTTPFSKYSPVTNNVVPQITKAYSPHGNAANNERGVATTGSWSNDGGSVNTACMDCHNSHGSNAGSGGTSTSYSSSVGGYGAGILYDRGGYTPAAGSGTPASYAASSDLCWDCHLGDGTAPKDYNTGFNNNAPIAGYYDGAGRWTNANGDDWTSSFSYKTAGTTGGNDDGQQKGGHFGKSPAALKTTPSAQVSGRCTVCHDPHGVNPAKTDAAYHVPALKGAWLTSPYKEDRAPGTQGANFGAALIGMDSIWYTGYTGRSGDSTQWKPVRFSPRFDTNNPPTLGAGYGTGRSGSSNWDVGGTGGDGYFVDENTFGTNITYGGANRAVTDTYTTGTNGERPWGVTTVTPNRISEADTQFAGLCLTCHTQAALTGMVYSNGTDTQIKVHNTVKGWYVAGNATDLFKDAQAAEHLMSYRNANTNSDSNRCTYVSQGTTPYIMPAGYRWGVVPGATAVGQTTHTLSNPPDTTSTQSVSGYKQNAYHQFPCSKCHTAHTSKLPRLMKTNCIDVGTSISYPRHRGGSYDYPANCDQGYSDNAGVLVNVMMECHNLKKSNTSGGGGWNIITGW